MNSTCAGPCRCNAHTELGRRPGIVKGKCLIESADGCGKWWVSEWWQLWSYKWPSLWLNRYYNQDAPTYPGSTNAIFEYYQVLHYCLSGVTWTTTAIAKMPERALVLPIGRYWQCKVKEQFNKHCNVPNVTWTFPGGLAWHASFKEVTFIGSKFVLTKLMCGLYTLFLFAAKQSLHQIKIALWSGCNCLSSRFKTRKFKQSKTPHSELPWELGEHHLLQLCK